MFTMSLEGFRVYPEPRRARRHRTCLAVPSEYACSWPFRNFQAPQHSDLPTFLLAIFFRIRTYEKRVPNSFRIRTYKTRHLKSFRIRTYKKRPGGGDPNLAWGGFQERAEEGGHLIGRRD
jgi:hypothetical protein